MKRDGHGHENDHTPVATNAVIDPVCGMTVDTQTAKYRFNYHGHPYYFCSAGCKTKFEANPAKYIGKTGAVDAGIAISTGTEVTIASSGVKLLRGDLGGIVCPRALSRAVIGNIRQNLFFTFICNAAGVPIASGVLQPVVRHPAVADARRSGHGPVVRKRDRQCAAFARNQATWTVPCLNASFLSHESA